MKKTNDLEIERRFLLKKLPDLPDLSNRIEITQVYLPKITKGKVNRYRSEVRTNTQTKYIHATKEFVSGAVTHEKEIDISIKEYHEAEEKADRTISKIRYLYPQGNLVWEIDKFSDINLIIAEIELPTEDHKFEIPEIIKDVIIMEITGMKEFSNWSLANKILKKENEI